MIYNDRLDSPVGHFLSKYCPKTARNEVKLFAKMRIIVHKSVSVKLLLNLYLTHFI